MYSISFSAKYIKSFLFHKYRIDALSYGRLQNINFNVLLFIHSVIIYISKMIKQMHKSKKKKTTENSLHHGSENWLPLLCELEKTNK